MTSKLPFIYTIRRSLRATKVRIIVRASQVEVVAPVKVAEKQIHQFVSAQQQWIVSALTKAAEQQQPVTPVFYGEGTTIIYLGESYLLTLKSSTLKRVKIEFTHTFIAFIPDTLIVTNHSEAIKIALMNWMKKQLLREVAHWVKQHAHKHQLFPRTINIRNQKSRWGSCGIHNDMQINMLLIMAPPAVLEYVVVHELCHIQVRNHSPQFWALVAEHLPDYKNPHRWLKQHGGRLMQGF